MRDAIQSAKVETLQGLVSFDENGDLTDHTVGLYQVKKDPDHPLNDMRYQLRRPVAAARTLDAGDHAPKG